MKYQAGGQMIDLALAGLQSTASGIANLKQNIDSGDFKKKNLFGKYADIMGATPMGMITNPILQPLAQAFASPDKTVISGSPGMYNTGGPVKGKRSQNIEGGFFMDDKQQTPYKKSAKLNGPMPFPGRQTNRNYQIPEGEQIDGNWKTPTSEYMSKLKSNYKYAGNNGNYDFYYNERAVNSVAVNKFNKKVANVDLDYSLDLLNLQKQMAPKPANSSAASKEMSTRDIQNMLKQAGYDVGPVDNIMGPKTRAALRQYQQAEAMKSSYQTGGDIKLSSDAMKVQGNPNVTDGNQYGPIALDHNEVVTKTQDGTNFVFSHDLKDPVTGKPFAQLAEKQSRAKGRAEKMLGKYPFDEQAKSTVSLSNANLNNISNTQELLAAKLGLRNQDGSTKQKFAGGGPIPYPGFNVLDFQKMYNQNISTPNAPLVEDNKWGPKTEAAYANYMQTKNINRQMGLPVFELPSRSLPDQIYSTSTSSSTTTPSTTDAISAPIESQYKTP